MTPLRAREIAEGLMLEGEPDDDWDYGELRQHVVALAADAILTACAEVATPLRETLKTVRVGILGWQALDRRSKFSATLQTVITAIDKALAGQPPKDAGLACFDCGRRYGDEHGFCDLVIPNEVWSKLSPSGNEGGLLCPSCMVKRAHDAGVICPAVFMSGPFSACCQPPVMEAKP